MEPTDLLLIVGETLQRLSANKYPACRHYVASPEPGEPERLNLVSGNTLTKGVRGAAKSADLAGTQRDVRFLGQMDIEYYKLQMVAGGKSGSSAVPSTRPWSRPGLRPSCVKKP